MIKNGLYATGIAMSALLANVATAETTVVFQGMGAEREAFNKEAIRLFEEQNPDIKIDYSWVANEPYKTGIKVMLESNSPPDLYFVWAGSFANDFVDSGVAENILDSYERGDAWGEAPAGVVDQFRYKDGLYGAPGQLYTKYFWKNDAFFEENNLTAPETIDELIGMCHQIREIDPLMTPVSFGASESWTINHYLTILFQRHVDLETMQGDWHLTNDEENLWAHPGYLNALKDFKRLETEGCFNDGINSVDPGVSRTMFATELAAMTFCGSWCPPIFNSEGFEGKYSAFPFPKVEGGAGDQTGALVGVQGYQVSAATEEREATLKFLSWLLSPEMHALQARLSGQLSANATALKEGDLPKESVDLLNRVAQANVSVPPLNTIVETSVSDVILKSGQDLVAGTVTPEEFMERVRTQALEAKSRM
ncbi:MULTISPECIES: ABC transporter substrate-binding protein [Halocynthiibacter]|uniref:Extracellular solute-binding protein n=1 Tax=Halocynthiibacter halioticoli TaxID=2986804 RepID=A0AAE3IZR1_9RHOB|nr:MULTISPECIES: extracellular solute-binding protein [Halocynthiibacter]MCV6823486.1 extracellular solute-binding protein [Halocynthiibacter halioticoli]MCW4056487.1 extracellular solute-binding protein [Halocynthiibacter sp. SDUM655004]